MSSLYLPGYEQIPILGCTGPGSYVSGYPWRIVLHTTESRFGSGPGIINFFKGQPCSTPHFMLDPGTGQKAQFIPIEYSAAALRGGQGGYETNRARAIQVEICGRADEASGWPDSVLKFIGEWIADVVAAGYPVNLDNITNNDYRGTVATANSPYRMSWSQWKSFDGVCGHIDVPGNDHYDPYRLDKRRCIVHAKTKLGKVTTGDWFDMATQADLKAVIMDDEVLSAIGKKAAYWMLLAKAEGQKDAARFPDLGEAIRQIVSNGPKDEPTEKDKIERIYNAVGAKA